MSSREFAEWMAYYTLEPFGVEREDLRAAIVASTIANANRDPKKKRQPYEPADFMPQFEEKKALSPEDLKAKVEVLNALFGGRDLRGNGGNP